jgi:hypothetical protein
MKISGVGPPGVPVDGVAPGEGTERPAESFTEKLQRGPATAGSAQPPGVAQPAAVGPLDDIAAELQAGKITPATAMDRLVERVVAAQVGAGAPAALKAQVTTAVRRALEDDPLLGQKLRALGR